MAGSPQPAAATVMQTKDAPTKARNAAPLQVPGAAAGIPAGAGTIDVDFWFVSGLIVAAISRRSSSAGRD